ncbi:hypothetical protein RB2501_06190 [Robiginitalea biformata HTCC2501]|uniref:Uncharacterized protein n=1 Tax=Robiginitalea biformata (strain ATCC BAA-864 / DSM 15991 / KCTC 12146 / HTCC2501) TaxID=313596 RepID=A4CHQ8_ROBBH|nr:hypothetical protein RB2501_06190 [Robiginitalea biformata HTCC2501]
MRKFFAGVVVGAGLLLISGGSDDFGDVYICKGPQSKRYHLKASCHGLSRCSTQTYKVTIEEARELGRTLCGYED